MAIERRDFVKGGAAASVLLLVGLYSAAKEEKTHSASVSDAASSPASGTASPIEKSIKAGFGDGFAVQSHTQSNGLTLADIEHRGNKYTVASADLLNWKIVRSSL